MALIAFEYLFRITDRHSNNIIFEHNGELKLGPVFDCEYYFEYPNTIKAKRNNDIKRIYEKGTHYTFFGSFQVSDQQFINLMKTEEFRYYLEIDLTLNLR